MLQPVTSKSFTKQTVCVVIVTVVRGTPEPIILPWHLPCCKILWQTTCSVGGLPHNSAPACRVIIYLETTWWHREHESSVSNLCKQLQKYHCTAQLGPSNPRNTALVATEAQNVSVEPVPTSSCVCEILHLKADKLTQNGA